MLEILYIEDLESDVGIVKAYLDEGRLEYNLYSTGYLWEGIELMHRQKIDILLLDLTVNDSAGFNTLKTITQKFPYQNVIVITGNNNSIIGIQSIKAGAQDFLVKGQFNSNSLERSIRYSIQRHQILLNLYDLQKRYIPHEKKYQQVIKADVPNLIINMQLESFIQVNRPALNLFKYRLEEVKRLKAHRIFLYFRDYERLVSDVNLSGSLHNYPISFVDKEGIIINHPSSISLINLDDKHSKGAYIVINIENQIAGIESTQVFESKEGFKNDMKELVLVGEIEKAIREFIAHCKKNSQTKLHNDLIVMANSFSEISRKGLIGSLDENFILEKRAKISYALLELLDRI